MIYFFFLLNIFFQNDLNKYRYEKIRKWRRSFVAVDLFVASWILIRSQNDCIYIRTGLTHEQNPMPAFTSMRQFVIFLFQVFFFIPIMLIQNARMKKTINTVIFPWMIVWKKLYIIILLYSILLFVMKKDWG